MKSAAIAGIAVLVALLLAGAYFLVGREEPAAPMTIEVEGGSGRGRTPGANMGQGSETPDLEVMNPVVPAPRTDATEESILRSGSLTLSTVDAVTGSTIPRFWVKRSDVGDMASSPAPRLSDPGSGKAVLPATDWDDEAPLRATDFLVSAPLYQPLLVSLEGPGAQSAVRTLKLTRAAAVVGVVRDGSSAPIPSARVTLEYLGSVPGLRPETSEVIPLPDSYAGPTLRRTDEAGRYAFDQLPPGSYRTRVERDGTTHLSDPVSVQPGRWAFRDHWLDEHVRLTVLVLQPDGLAAEKARVLLLPEPPDLDQELPLNATLPESTEKLVTRYTDGEGRATLGPLGAGRYRVFIQSDDGEAPPKALQVEEQSRSILDLEFRLTTSEQSR